MPLALSINIRNIIYNFRPGFAETLYGRKRWFLTAPDVKPEFHPNKTTLQWLMEDYERVKTEVIITLRVFEKPYFLSPRWICLSAQ